MATATGRSGTRFWAILGPAIRLRPCFFCVAARASRHLDAPVAIDKPPPPRRANRASASVMQAFGAVRAKDATESPFYHEAHAKRSADGRLASVGVHWRQTNQPWEHGVRLEGTKQAGDGN